MFKNSYQNGLLSIFYSCGSNPLAIWDMEVKNGHIKRLTDSEVNSIVLEIVSTNVATTYMVCPKNNQVLGIRLPFLVMIIKNLKRYFSFEITILDDKNMRRRFRISNFQSTTKINPFLTSMPIGLAQGWNQVQFNLADFTRRAYGSQFIETLKVQVHANARVRRIYFSEKLYTEEELPQEYKLYLPLERKQKKSKELKSERAAAPPPKAATTEPAKGAATESAPAALGAKSSKKIVGKPESAITRAGDEKELAPAGDLGTEEAPEQVAAPVEGETTAVADTDAAPSTAEAADGETEGATEPPSEAATDVATEEGGETGTEPATPVDEPPAESAPDSEPAEETAAE